MYSTIPWMIGAAAPPHAARAPQRAPIRPLLLGPLHRLDPLIEPLEALEGRIQVGAPCLRAARGREAHPGALGRVGKRLGCLAGEVSSTTSRRQIAARSG